MNTNQSTRPYGLPTELPDPPEPPAGHRGVYRGMGWDKQGSPWAVFNPAIGKWSSFSKYAPPLGSDGNFYIEYIPLRPTPERVAQVPEGFEYFHRGKVDGVDTENQSDIALLAMDGYWQMPATGDCSHMMYALRIGSEIHHRHFDAPEPVTEPNVVAGNTVTVQPAKAREWWLTLATEGNTRSPGQIIGWDQESPDGPWEGCKWEVALFREVRADEAGLLEEAVGLLRTAEAYPEIGRWLLRHFPAPAPEPAFDWDEFWAIVPAWHDFAAMNENKNWKTHEGRPKVCLRKWAEENGNCLRIPDRLSPPPAADWKTSLVQRPTPAQP